MKTMLVNHILLAAVWVVYVVLHSVLASIGFKNKIQKILGGNFIYYRLAYTIFAFVFLVALLWWQVTMPTLQLYPPFWVSFLVGGVIAAVGLSIMLVCIHKYFTWLSGLRTILQKPVTSQLIISGIHRHVRHPLYIGTFIFIWGLLLIFPYLSLLISNIIITSYTMVAVRFEEEKLVAEYGDAYRDYQKAVPRFIPKF